MKTLLRWPRWWPDDSLLDAVRSVFAYGSGEDRATGNLFGDGRRWPDALVGSGSMLLDQLDALLNVRFSIVAFQAYRTGSGCDWHADTPFDAQAILSLGATRTFGIRTIHPERHEGGEVQLFPVHHGDLVYMPPGFQADWEHCVPIEDEPGERVSLVFRTPAKG